MGIATLHPSLRWHPAETRRTAKDALQDPHRSCHRTRRPSPSPPFHVKRNCDSDRYVDLLVAWQTKTNLVAPSTLPHLWTRHVSDSLQLLDLAPSAKTWVDLGSGGGFPGVVLACALAETPGANVHLVERNAKKAAFLREAIRVTSAAGTVHLAGIGDIVDRIGSRVRLRHRASAGSVTSACRVCGTFVRDGAKALFLKGQDVEAELTEATKYWNIEPRLHSSRTGGHGWIVELDRIERRNPSRPHMAIAYE